MTVLDSVCIIRLFGTNHVKFFCSICYGSRFESPIFGSHFNLFLEKELQDSVWPEMKTRKLNSPKLTSDSQIGKMQAETKERELERDR